jgi:hypothetical protein
MATIRDWDTLTAEEQRAALALLHEARLLVEGEVAAGRLDAELSLLRSAIKFLDDNRKLRR